MGLKVLCDKGYQGEEIGIIVRLKAVQLRLGVRSRSASIARLRAPAEDAIALREAIWRVLRPISLEPSCISTVVAAMLALATLKRGTR